MMSSSPTIPAVDNSPQPAFSAALTRKLILTAAGVENEKQIKLSNEAVDLASELLRLFVVEARHRASIQAECDDEEEAARDVESSSDETKKIRIQPHHVTKIGAELLMDFMIG